ncbi:hypothetical protein OESDEN_24691 [Oesophagostomum dentatum]|uniref:Uncharacterized protein n=1 Tax=Oesophagostomum dentatum TaxID=61180 RepID=A0A0B1RRM7_OESDE|nr:hypothetical protein OESDEN_24691 [Oesophagostomum dentatum]
MLLLHRELKEWDRKYDELAEAMKRMEIARERLHERIKEQRQRTSAARLVCADLDRKLHELCGSGTSAKHNYCHSHGLKSQFSTVTTSSSHERTTFVEEITLPPS